MIGALKRKLREAYRSFKRNRYYFSEKADGTRDYFRRHNPPALSAEEIKEIDAFWKQFGIRLEHHRWHQMYYDMTGIKDPAFLPQNLAEIALYPYYNELKKTKVWADKNYFQRFVPVVQFPTMLGQRIRGLYYDAKHQAYTPQELDAFCEAIYRGLPAGDSFSVIIKQTIDTMQGRGVKKYDFSSREELLEILKKHADQENYLIQKAIRQHPFFAQFNSSSVNIVRVTTWRNGKDILAFSPCIRFGIKGSGTDVAYVNGEEIINCIGILPDGRVRDEYITLAGEKLPFIGELREVPHWNEIVETVKKAHSYLEQFDLVAWDMTVDEQGQIICIEYNIRSPGTIVSQMADGPFAGEHTRELLQFLTQPQNRKKYLPKKLRID